MSKKLDKVQQALLLDLPIRYTYKNKIKHICEKHNIRVQSFLEYVLRSYFDDDFASMIDYDSDLSF